MRSKTRWAATNLAILAAIGCLVMPGILARMETYATAAGRYREYARNYEPHEGLTEWTSCYGSRWDDYSNRLLEDLGRHGKEPGYRESRAAEFRRLASKYERAANRPWRSVPLDPPLDVD